MKSKQQKISEIADTEKILKDSKSIVFVNFTKTPVQKINELKSNLRAEGSVYRVMKKRLFGVLFQKKEIPVDMKSFEDQFAAIFSPKDITTPSGIAFRFSKEVEKEGLGFKLVGGIDLETKLFFSNEDIRRVGQLPSRDILLAQLAGILNAPVKKLAYVLSEIGKSKS